MFALVRNIWNIPYVWELLLIMFCFLYDDEKELHLHDSSQQAVYISVDVKFQLVFLSSRAI